MKLISWQLLCVSLFVGCTFDGSGPNVDFHRDGTIEGVAPREAGLDFFVIDRSVDADTPLRDLPHDTPPTDVATDGSIDSVGDLFVDITPPDTLWPDVLSSDTRVDSGPVVVPVSSAEVGQALQAELAPCVDRYGNISGADISIVDSSSVSLVAGTVTLAGAPASTSNWVGGQSAATVIWDPNACDLEDPINNDGEWGSAGMLIRGASIQNGALVLAPTTTVADMDFLDVTSSGAFEGSTDFAGPGDTGLWNHPQLAGVVAQTKLTILGLGLN